MIVDIHCELTKDCDKISESKLHELADFLSEFFDGNCEYFSVERKKE